MAFPIHEFGRLVGRFVRGVRLVSYGFIGVMVFLLVFRVAEVATWLAERHVMLAVAFVLALLLALAWLVGRPLWRYFHVPVVMRPPRLPAPAARRPRDLVRHVAFIERYLEALPENPAWSGDRAELRSALAACRCLGDDARRARPDALPALSARVGELERGPVARLLAPLDRQAADVIRSEALKVGLATAVSPYGTLDAFLVLWRNVNLVAKIAGIYYGRPGMRGTFGILRDVAMATVAGAYLQDLAGTAGELIGSLAGKTAGFFTGPLMEGCLNGVATLRVGYLAKGRCRAFHAWTQRTACDAAQSALTEAARFSGGLVTDVVRVVGGGVLRLPARALAALVERITGTFKRPQVPPPERAPGG
ncbi:MAG: DUF697 domain-containing protein [Planctomycetota bacterium]